jgi:hypothetical protein
VKKKLQEVIEREEREGRSVNREETLEERRQRQQFQERMDIEDRDIIIQGSNTTRLSRKQVKFYVLSVFISLDTVLGNTHREECRALCNRKTVVITFTKLEFTNEIQSHCINSVADFIQHNACLALISVTL